MKKKYTKQEFIEKAKKTHGNKYNYSLIEYKNSLTKIKIICPIHGKFEQMPSNHLAGNGCKKCAVSNRASLKKYTTKDFINKAKKIHGNQYDYSITKYKNSKLKIKIICPIHGEFEQIPSAHLFGQGCKYCGILKTTLSRKTTTEEFIKKAKKIHGDKYNYSFVKYKNPQTLIKISCPKHGVFEQLPYTHLNSHGCPKCGRESVWDKSRGSGEKFIEKSNKIHNNKYDYSLVKYKNARTKVKIICNLHGIFEKRPYVHLNGRGCPICFYESQKDNKEIFIKKAIKTHGDKYDYSLVKYKNSKQKIKIICPHHGIFEQTPSVHIRGYGCQICHDSIGERIIRLFLKRKNIKFKYQKTFKDCINPVTNKNLIFDFYLPNYNLCIEYDGELHYKPIKYFGGIDALKKIQERDKVKTLYCKKNKINLLRIKYDENITNSLGTFLAIV